MKLNLGARSAGIEHLRSNSYIMNLWNSNNQTHYKEVQS